MRSVVIDEIYNLMKENDNVYFLTGDLGFSVVEKLEKDFPNRFINVGIAEQNMIGVAAGLAMSGKKVIAYSIIPFITMRCFEQIRNDICYHNADVMLLGAGAGLSYGILSSTHFALEDIAVIRSLPNISVFSPVDAIEAKLGMEYFKKSRGPVYFRIGKKEEPIIFEKPYPFVFGNGHVIQKGKDIVIFVTGTLMKEVLESASLLKQQGIDATVVDIHTIKPLDTETVIVNAKGKKLAVTVEEHNITGGLGSAVAEVLSEYSNTPKLMRIGTPDIFIKTTGTQQYLRSQLGLTPDQITTAILKSLS